MMKRICIIHDTDAHFPGHLSWFAFHGLPGVEICGYADRNPQADKSVFLGTGARHFYLDWREMLAREHPDIVVLSSRSPEEHEVQIGAALDHGCHVLCEKPFVRDLQAADELVGKAKQKGLLIQLLYLARFAPAFQEMKRLLHTGGIGRPLSCLLRGKEDQRGGGEDMIVLGSHLLDIAVFLFGAPETVYGEVRQGGRLITSQDTIPTAEPLGPCAGDEVFAHFRMGGVQTCFTSRRGMLPFGGCTRMGIVVTGTKGQLAVRYDGERELRICRDFPMPPEDEAHFEPVPVKEPPEIPGALPYSYEALHVSPEPSHRYFAENNRRAAWNLLQAIDGKEELVSPASEALHTQEMLQAVFQSSLEARRLDFPLTQRKHPLSRSWKS